MFLAPERCGVDAMRRSAGRNTMENTRVLIGLIKNVMCGVTKGYFNLPEAITLIT